MAKKSEDEMHTEKKESTSTAVCSDMDIFGQEIKLKRELKDKLDEDVVKLTTIKGAIEDKLKDYCAKRGELETARNEFIRYHKLKAPMIENIVKDKKTILDKIITNYNSNITAIIGEITKWENEKIPATRMEFCTADNVYKKTKYEFNKQEEKIKNYQASCEEKLDKLAKLKEEIDKHDETEDGPIIYVKLNELKRILDEVELQKGEILVQEFYTNFKNYDNSDKDRQGKKEKQKITIDELKEKKDNFMELKKKRKDELVKEVNMQTWEKS